MKTTPILAAALGLAPLFAGTAFAETHGAEPVQIGSLSCNLGLGDGSFTGEGKMASCIFDPAQDAFSEETYDGEVNSSGPGSGETVNGSMAWLVFAPSADSWSEGGLAGSFTAISDEGAFGSSLGRDVLGGGTEGKLALQPLNLGPADTPSVFDGVTEMQLKLKDG